jgi:putative ABC transport system substrate-binding protein
MHCPKPWGRVMRRREVITLIGSAALTLPLATYAQSPPKIPRVGWIVGSPLQTVKHVYDAFRQGLRDLGYVEGQTIAIEPRSADGHMERMPGLVDELIRLKVDVLAVTNSPAALAAKKATRTIPIVMFAGDPIGLGLVTSLARPGGNVTGMSYFSVGLHTKRLELMKRLVPGLTRVAVLKNPLVIVHAIFWQEVKAAAQKLGMALQPIEVRRPEDFEPAFAATTRAKAQALLALDDPLTIGYRSRIVGLAASSRLPAIYGFREFADAGGLITYGADFVDLFRRSATYVDKILKGAKPADLPIEQPTKFELVINLKAAKALGLTVPPLLLAQADDVIE